MRQLELNIYNKVKRDFSAEIKLLEIGLNTIVMYGQLITEQSDYADTPNLRNKLLNANRNDRCLTTQILLIKHAITFLKAARLLLLTGYQVPSLSCLRTAFESFQNAYICLTLDEQAIRFLNGKPLNKKVEIDYPVQLEKSLAREIKATLANYGVHANFDSLEVQALYEGSIFEEKNRTSYEFIFLRNLFSFFTILMYFLAYLIEKWPMLTKELPNAINVTRDLGRKVTEIDSRLKELAEN